MKFFVYTALFLYSNYCFSQTISGRITGEHNESVEFANISLKNISDSSFVAGSLTDTAGLYSITNFKPGNYFIDVRQTGYVHLTSLVIKFSGTETIKQDLQLQEINVQLSEVTVQGQKAVIVQEPGKIIFDVESSVSSAGLMAIDLLKRLPGVQVDNNGNISIKGKSEILFMIDGKPSYLSSKQIAVILRSLPSNQISNIEVITSPSAKYDARGNAGIININLKKSDKKGISGTLQATYGQGILYKSNIGGSIAIGLRKWQVNALYDLTQNRNLDYLEQVRNFGGAQSTKRYSQVQRYEIPVENHNYRIGVDYKPNSKLGIGLSHRGMYAKDKWISTNTGTVTDRNKGIEQTIISHDNNPNHNSDLAFGGNIKYKPDTLGQEISADAEISNYKQRSIQDIRTTTFNHDTISTLDFFARLPLDNVIAWGKLDYTKPLLKALKLETGYKITSTEIINSVDYRVNNTGPFKPDIPPNNRFFYSEQINALYASLKWDSTNWSLQVGLRAEHWRASGMLPSTNFKRDSLQLFPNIQAKYKLSKKHEVILAGSRRVDRPNYLMLNPIAYYSDPYTYYIGNPKILPQSTYQTELSHNYSSGLIVTTINYSKTSNAINDYAAYQTSDTSKIQFMGPTNITGLDNYGISTSLYFTVIKNWTCQAYFNLYRNHFYGKAYRYEIDFQQTAWTATSTQSFLLPRSWSAEINGNYSSPSIYGYTRNNAMWMLSLGIKKELWNGKIVAKLNFQDVFYTFQYRGKSLLPELNSEFTYRWDNRVISFSLLWKLERNSSFLKEKEKN